MPQLEDKRVIEPTEIKEMDIKEFRSKGGFDPGA